MEKLMAHYVCIENNEVTSILNYEPNVPSSIIVDTITDTEADTILINNNLFSFWKYNHTVKGVQESGTIDLTLTVQESNTTSGDEWYTVKTDSVDADGEITSVTGDVYGVRQRLIITGTGTQSAVYTHRLTLKKEY